MLDAMVIFESGFCYLVGVCLCDSFLSCVFLQSPQTVSKGLPVSSTSTTSDLVVPSTISSAPALPLSTQGADPLDCDWSEHRCPDGYKYYYNCTTCESRVRFF